MSVRTTQRIFPLVERLSGASFLDRLLANQRQMYRVQLCIAISLVVAGLSLIAVGSVFAGVLLPDYWKWLLALGGTLVASLSSLKVNEIYSTKSRIDALSLLRADFVRASSPLAATPAEDLAMLEDRVRRLFDRTLGL